MISPDHATEDFLSVVDMMGLHKVSYNVGWTAWLDIAPDGVNKATGMQFVVDELGIPGDRILAIGDGRNDIDMLQWAVAGGGLGIAMGQAPPEVVGGRDRADRHRHRRRRGDDARTLLPGIASRTSRYNRPSVIQEGCPSGRWSQS